MKNITKNKKIKYGANSIILTIVTIGVIVLLNILLSKYTYQKDLTEGKIFNLSEKTKVTLQNLDKSGKMVNVYWFTPTEDYLDFKTKKIIEGMLGQYDDLSKNLTLEKINIDNNPTKAEKYGIKEGYEVVFEYDGRTKIVSIMESYDGMSFNGEQQYTSAINYVQNENPPVVYFIQGHDEANLDKDITYLKKQIETNGFVIKTVNISLEGKIPNDASMIIDIGPKNEFAQKEVDVIKGYLNNGGKFILLTSSLSENQKMNGLNNVLSDYGVRINNDIVLDNSRNFMGNSPNLIIPNYETNEIVKKLAEQTQYYMILPDSRSINILGMKDVGIEPLLKTSNDSWGEINLKKYLENKIVFDKKDNIGPLYVGTYISKLTANNKETEIVVLGSSMGVYDNILNTIKSGANIEFVINSMDKLSPTEQQITIGPKSLDFKTLTLPSVQQKIIFFSLVVILPLIILSIGVVVWIRRRFL